MFVYTAYVDESGTHDGSPVTVMGGVLARADQWKVFENKFAGLQSQYGFKVWHTKKFKRKKGDFRGWSDEKCHDLYWSMQQVTSFGLTDIVALTLNNASYEAEYCVRQSHNRPKTAAVLPRFCQTVRASSVNNSGRPPRFVIAVLIGVDTTLAWQSYGDEARNMVVARAPTLAWLLSLSTTKSANRGCNFA